MPTGGPRTAKPGASYGNRSDLTASADATYGDQVNQEAIRSATPNTSAPGLAPGQGAGGPPPPGSLTPIGAPTQRPGEPASAGLSMGPGPGPDGLTPTPTVNMDLYTLRALAQIRPSRDLDRLIAYAETET